MRAFGGIRTRGLPLRRRMPYPLGHEGVCSLSWGRTNVHGSKDRCPAIRRSGIVAYGLPVRRWPQACSVLSAISRMVWESNPLPAFAGTFLAERRLDRPFGPPSIARRFTSHEYDEGASGEAHVAAHCCTVCVAAVRMVQDSDLRHQGVLRFSRPVDSTALPTIQSPTG